MMTSRERVLAAVNHSEPDRVAVDMGSTPSSGISAIAYSNLVNYINANDKDVKIYDVVQQLAEPSNEIIEKFGVDVIDIGRTFNTNPEKWYDTVLANGASAKYPSWFKPKKQSDGSYHVYSDDGDLIAKMPVGATFFDQTYFPYESGYPAEYSSLKKEMGKVLWQCMPHSPWDHSNEPDFWERLRANAIEARQNTDKALMVVCGCNLFEWGTFLRRIDNFLMDIMFPEEVMPLLDELIQIHMKTLENVCKYLGDVVDILRFGDDLGMNSGPFMAPETYRQVFKPYHSKLCEYVHKHSGMKTFLHSCGSIYKLLPDLIEAGYDIINPVQTTCADMEPERLKKEFGNDIVFWGGGANTKEILNKGTVEEVKTDVKKRLEIFAPGGGFVFNTIHNIMPDVPPQNVVAMFEAIDEFYR